MSPLHSIDASVVGGGRVDKLGILSRSLVFEVSHPYSLLLLSLPLHLFLARSSTNIVSFMIH
jgi:hypothetical protein